MKKETILLHPENPYFNVNVNKSRRFGNVISFYNNIIGLSRLSDIAALRKDRNHTNPDWFVKQVANW